MTTRRWLIALVAALALLLIAGRIVAGVFAEWSWYASMGALPLYQSMLAHQVALRVSTALIAFSFAFANLYTVRRSIVSLVLPRRLGNIELGEAVEGRLLTLAVLGLSALLAIILALPDFSWTSLALARNAVPFDELDPYLDHDFGFYVYNLPFERSVYLWAVVTMLLVSFVVIALYALTPSLRLERGRLYVSAYVRRHFAALAAIGLGLVSWSYRLQLFTLISSGSGANGTFTAFDHRIAIPLLTGLALGSMVATVVVFWSGWHGYPRVAVTVLTVLIVAGPAGLSVLPRLAAWSSSDADVRARERPYLATQVLFTRRAYGLDRIVSADSAHITLPLRESMALGTSSWDPSVLIRAAEIDRHGFTGAATAWDGASGTLSAMVALRPSGGTGRWEYAAADVISLDERGRVLPHPTVSFDPAQRFKAAGYPVWIEKSPPAAFALIADSSGVIAAPPFSSWWQRLGHAWHLQNPRLFTADAPSPRPRLVLHRALRERIEALVPFFVQGPTLQAVVAGDSLYWIVDLFVATDDYPLSQPLLFAGESTHYLQLAATAVVQAQTGRVHIVPRSRPDPITRSWMRRYPSLFTSRALLPSGLNGLWPPHVDWAAMQADALVHTGFHGDTINPKRVAHASGSFSDTGADTPLLYLNQGDSGALAWSQAILDSDERIIGALVARGGEVPRTEWHRASGSTPWREVLEKLLGAAGAAGYDRGVTRGRRGAVQVLPTRTGMVYAQSFYDWPTDGPPSLTGVVLYDGKSSAAGATVAQALGVIRPATATGTEAFRSRVNALYEAMSNAMQHGNWIAFGDAYTSLGRLLRAARAPD